MGNLAARPSALLIVTGCHIRAATAKAAHLVQERAGGPHARTTLYQFSGGFDPFVSRANARHDDRPGNHFRSACRSRGRRWL
jgi:hypothetical protein